MKHILISIQPEHCCNILNKDKILEIRKSIPKCELPCKVHIYCTKDNSYKLLQDNETRQYFKGITSGNNAVHPSDTEYGMNCEYETQCCTKLNGKVVAEFTLNKVEDFKVFENGLVQHWNWLSSEKSCLKHYDIELYIGYGKTGYGWHIDNLIIYDKPKELSEFIYPCPKGFNDINNYACYKDAEHIKFCKYCKDGKCNAYVKRPPQSWCYIKGE